MIPVKDYVPVDLFGGTVALVRYKKMKFVTMLFCCENGVSKIVLTHDSG